ncbi:MAG: hypothetical protein ACR2IF_18235 [Terriglobales bacterium]
MSRLWKAIRGLIWWTQERGSVQYDVMVTLILAFIFITPHFVNFKDKPVERTPHPTGVVVYPDGVSGFVYQIEAAAVRGQDDASRRAGVLQIIEPIAGEVEITSIVPVKDAKGRVVAYNVRVSR